MLIEIHMLQNHAPSNLNRDDTGSPKECIFGGVKRGRISSQCLKRSIRRSPIFQDELKAQPLAFRTRTLPDLVKQRLLAKGLSQELADVAALKATGFGTKEGKERADEGNTAQTMFLSDYDVEAVVKVLYEAATAAKTAAKFKEVPAKDLQAQAAQNGWRPITPDIALFGRMITSAAFNDVQSALQVAHALSTNKIDHEFDYFTAVDDLQNGSDDDKGADMIGDVEFNSACYYKYLSLDFDALVANLCPPAPKGQKGADAEEKSYQKAVAAAREAALALVPALLKAAIFTTPSGKQNTFAAHQLPDAILIEVRPQCTPVSYANAFVNPARPSGESDLVDQSIAKLVEHVDRISNKFSLKTAARLWFTTRDATPKGTAAAPVTSCETVDDLLAELKKAMPARGAHHG